MSLFSKTSQFVRKQTIKWHILIHPFVRLTHSSSLSKITRDSLTGAEKWKGDVLSRASGQCASKVSIDGRRTRFPDVYWRFPGTHVPGTGVPRSPIQVEITLMFLVRTWVSRDDRSSQSCRELYCQFNYTIRAGG